MDFSPQEILIYEFRPLKGNTGTPVIFLMGVLNRASTPKLLSQCITQGLALGVKGLKVRDSVLTRAIEKKLESHCLSQSLTLVVIGIKLELYLITTVLTRGMKGFQV